MGERSALRERARAGFFPADIKRHISHLRCGRNLLFIPLAICTAGVVVFGIETAKGNFSLGAGLGFSAVDLLGIAACLFSMHYLHKQANRYETGDLSLDFSKK